MCNFRSKTKIFRLNAACAEIKEELSQRQRGGKIQRCLSANKIIEKITKIGYYKAK